MRSSFVQMFLGTLTAIVATACTESTPLVASPNAEMVRVELRDSPPDVQIFQANALHHHRRAPNTMDPPIYCATSPCDASVMGGTVLRAGGPDFESRAFRLPAKGVVRVRVDPGSGLGEGLSAGGILVGSIGSLLGGGLIAAGAIDGCNCAHYDSGASEIVAGGVILGTSLALAVVSLWVFERSRATIKIEPVVRF